VIGLPHFFGCDSAGVPVRDGGGLNTDGPFAVPGCWRAVALLAVVVMSCGGCNGDGNSVAITGCIMLDGSHIPAEIQIEQLDKEGTRVGRATMAYADDGGQFSASIERQNDADGPLTCNLVVRVSQISRNGMPAAFDESAPREKVVRLIRVVRHNDSMNLLLTR
jgi:hypothetical protein